MGHLIAAAGAVEVVVCALAIQHGVDAGQRQLSSIAIPTATSIWSSVGAGKNVVRMTLSNSFGFGGSNSCVVLRHPGGSERRGRAGRLTWHIRVLITGIGAVCGIGHAPDAILDAAREGRSAIAPIAQWDTTGWPVTVAAEVPDFNPRALVEDRKLHKLIRRTDMFGLYAASQAIDASGFIRVRDALDSAAAAIHSDRSGLYVGSGGGAYNTQYEYFPLMTETGGDMVGFGRELASVVNPMWLLRTLPNNVLCHVGIKYNLKGANACITNHSCGGTLAVIEAAEALRHGEADRAVAVGHDTLIEPQMVLYYHQCGLLASDTIRPFDARRSAACSAKVPGRWRWKPKPRQTSAMPPCSAKCSVGATRAKRWACSRSAMTGTGSRGRSASRSPTRKLRPRDIGMIVAHGNGTQRSDASEAAAIRSDLRRRRRCTAGDGLQVGDRPSDRGGRHRRSRDCIRRVAQG